MKKTTFHKIFLILLAMSFLAGCGSENKETEPTYDTYSINTETTAEESLDSEIIETSEPDAETEPDVSAAGDPIEIAFAPEEYDQNSEDYEVYHFEGLEYGSDAVLIPSTEIYNFQFFSLEVMYQASGVEYKISEILHTCDGLSPDKPFATRIYIAGPGGTHYGVSFLDEAGNQYRYVIFESGEDGSLYLAAF